MVLDIGSRLWLECRILFSHLFTIIIIPAFGSAFIHGIGSQHPDNTFHNPFVVFVFLDTLLEEVECFSGMFIILMTLVWTLHHFGNTVLGLFEC